VYTPSAPAGIVDYAVQKAPDESSRIIAAMLDIIEEAAPLPPGRRKDLRYDVLELWRDLTSEKSTRQADYIGEPARLAAYLRYFLPWNVVRLVPLLAGLDLSLAAGDAVLDIGSGPLTVPIALWIARPDLRGVKLRIDCIDRVKRVMEIGSTVLESLALRVGQPFAWEISTSKASFPLAPDGGEHSRYALVSAANVFNEGFWKVKGSLGERADALAAALGARVAPGGRCFIVEPGDPRSGAMLAALRESVILSGGRPIAPCPHDASCPMAGAFLSSAFRKDDEEQPRQDEPRIQPVVTARGRSKAPWCHFVIDPSAAPEKLTDFSEASGLPKDRLIASWLLLQPSPPAGTTAGAAPAAQPERFVRIISDAFRLPDGAGRYACTKTGYTLVRGSLADLPSGTLVRLDTAVPPAASYRDVKSGAIVVTARSESIPPAAMPTPRNIPAARPSALPASRPPRKSTPKDKPKPRAKRFNGKGKPRR
jgi:hypothetical protein